MIENASMMISSQINNSTVYPMNIHPAAAFSTVRNENSSTMGKVVRIRPNIYVFVCEYCASEHRSIDSFLRHTESHFQCDSTSTTPSSARTTPLHSRSVHFRQQSLGYTNGNIPPFNGNPSYQNTLNLAAQNETIGITASPSRDSDDYIEEVFEIVDLGYDMDGIKYPMARSVDVEKEKKSKNGTPKNFPCPFCSRQYTRNSTMERHKRSAHNDILTKLVSLKKSFKCLVCNTKFPKPNKFAAELHMKEHFRGQAKENK